MSPQGKISQGPCRIKHRVHGAALVVGGHDVVDTSRGRMRLGADHRRRHTDDACCPPPHASTAGPCRYPRASTRAPALSSFRPPLFERQGVGHRWWTCPGFDGVDAPEEPKKTRQRRQHVYKIANLRVHTPAEPPTFPQVSAFRELPTKGGSHNCGPPVDRTPGQSILAGSSAV